MASGRSHFTNADGLMRINRLSVESQGLLSATMPKPFHIVVLNDNTKGLHLQAIHYLVI
jgi:hypothetical protein